MAVCVICEFNPFHNGHKYLLKKAKELAQEPVAAIMSGSFTQRGDAAICDKFTRADAALQNGADLVLELPAVYSCANAERFAKAGVEIAKSFDCINYLAFGCETDDIDLLNNAVNSLQNTDVQAHIKNDMKNGGYYPRAAENAVRTVTDADTANVLSSPNNILAVEYLKNLTGSNIIPLPIKRIGTAHDSSVPNGNIASASYIRNLLRNGESAKNYMPLSVTEITFPENLERIILYKLRSMSPADFAELPDVSEGLENRIFTAVNKYNSVKEITDYIKTKRYTHARIRRIITCALLGITEQLQNTPIEYVRVLGFTPAGAELLKHCGKHIVTSSVKGLCIKDNTEKLLKKDIFASDVISLAYEMPKNRGADFTTPVVKHPFVTSQRELSEQTN